MKRGNGKSCDNWNDQRKTAKNMLEGLTKRLNVGQVTDAVKVTRDPDAW